MIHDSCHLRVSGRLLLVVTVMLVTACTRPAKVESAWVEGVPRTGPFSNIVVVGVTPNYNTRCRFERMVRDALDGAGVRTVTSCSKLGSKDPLTREALARIVAEVGADAVLSTRLVDGSTRLVEGATDEARDESYYKPIGYGHDPIYGPYGVPVVYGTFVAEDPAFTLRRTVVVSSNLYEGKGATLVYTLDTTVYDKKTQGEVFQAIGEAITGRLRLDKLLP